MLNSQRSRFFVSIDVKGLTLLLDRLPPVLYAIGLLMDQRGEISPEHYTQSWESWDGS